VHVLLAMQKVEGSNPFSRSPIRLYRASNLASAALLATVRRAEARARLGDYFAEVLLLGQATDAGRARAELGWKPSHSGLVDEFRNSYYRKVSAAT
jgi:hypothetical protein